MAGLKENIAPMWNLLRKNGLELEPAVSLKSNVYLGCSQREVEPDQKLIDAKSEMMQRLCFDKSSSGKPTHTNIPDLKEPSEATAPSKPKTKKKKGGGGGSNGNLRGLALLMCVSCHDIYNVAS